RVTDNKGKTHDVLTGSDDGRHSNTSLAWGAGVQFNPTESVAVDKVTQCYDSPPFQAGFLWGEYGSKDF
uniref:Ail/Lom family outer membrane beta-barrel protein n=1 Tax=Escherichia coli TaxID=562 RepID=UPI000A5279AB